jgi:acid phosphatase
MRSHHRTGRTGQPPRPSALGVLWALTLVLALMTGCTGGSGSGDSTAGPGGAAAEASSSTAALPRPDHVMVVVFENKDAGVVGSKNAPYLTSLARSAAHFTDAHGVTHPSQPNYLALFSGSTHGVKDNTCPLKLSGDNLASQLLAAGESFTGYTEGLPKAGFTGCSSGDYRRKHNPWVNWADLPETVNQPLTAMPSDFDKLPTVSFVVPDMCNSMHDCDVATGDRWAEKHLAPYLAWATDHHSLLIVTFDEDDDTSDNHIDTIVAGAGVRATTTEQRIDHYDVLHALESMYGLELLGRAADARGLSGIWS